MTEQARAQDTHEIGERDDAVETTIAEALEAIAADARRDPQAYARQTEVEHGGE